MGFAVVLAVPSDTQEIANRNRNVFPSTLVRQKKIAGEGRKAMEVGVAKI
jgi:hypothetical protein